MLQIRLTIFSTILLIGYYATLATFIFMLKEEFNDHFLFHGLYVCRWLPSF